MIENNELPAYVRLKFAKRCSTCIKEIRVGELAFWFRSNNKCHHAICGLPEWKVPGSPYDTRKQLGIKYSQERENQEYQEEKDSQIQLEFDFSVKNL